MKINLGCGRDVIQDEGWVNYDLAPHPGAVQADVYSLPLGTGVGDYLLASHLIEHLDRPLDFMTEAWRVAKPGALMEVRCPHGGSDDAWEDPTHVRPYFPGSFGYFSQPYYWRADYGYRADWKPVELALFVPEQMTLGMSLEEIYRASLRQRNIVAEMVCVMEAVKPARPPERELQEPPRLRIIRQ